MKHPSIHSPNHEQQVEHHPPHPSSASPVPSPELPIPQRNAPNSQIDHRRELAMSSPIRSPIQEAAPPITQKNSQIGARREAATESPFGSPIQDAELPIPLRNNAFNSQIDRRRESPPAELPIPRNNDYKSPIDRRREAAISSPIRSPIRDAQLPIPQKNPFDSQIDDRREAAISSPISSPLRSPIRDVELPVPQKNDGRREAEVSFPLRSPIRDAEPQKNPFDNRRREMESPLRSPIRDGDLPIPPLTSQIDGRRVPDPVSPLLSPIRGAEQLPVPHRNQLISQFVREGSMNSPALGLNESLMESPLRFSPEGTTAVAANRLFRDETAAVTKSSGGGVVGDRGRVVSGIGRRAAVRKAAVGLRLSAVVFCVAAFSVMAADKTKGWAGDSFDRYKEYRYCLSVNVVAFVYSSFQLYAQVHRMMRRSHILPGPIRYYFDFTMDQILAYLLISASSAAATRTDSWVSMFGSDKFTDMTNGSIAMSFLGFVVFALSSLISAHELFGTGT